MTTPRTPDGQLPRADGPDPLERSLGALTEWRDAEPSLYAQALRQARTVATHAPAARDGAEPAGRRRIRPAVAIPVIAAAALVMFAAAEMWSGRVNASRSGHAPASPAASPEAFVDADRQDKAVNRAPAAEHAGSPGDAGERSVVRKASIEIRSKDVKADFARARMFVNDALGEFIETSALTGEGRQAQATLTLRVTASRLADVLNAVRGLGTVVNEQSTGDDVTTQVVDVDARLRNERRVETEMLALLETRKGAPLKEVLDLREQLARVRERIEQMTAQQERLSRNVTLATVLVVIQPEPAADAQESRLDTPMSEYFAARLDASWHAGTRALADSVAAIVRAAVGGLVWWIGLSASFIGVSLAARSARRRGAHEPAPMLGG